MKICICGGGSLGHICAGVFATQFGVELNILSGHPTLWRDEIVVEDPEGKVFKAKLHLVSSDPKEVAMGQDLILFCLPGYLIEKTLREIKPFIGTAVVGTVFSCTGFFPFAHEILGANAKLFGFQRVPFIARVKEYGHSANLLGYRSSLTVVLENIGDSEAFRAELERLFLTPVALLDSFYEVALSNSNPILHTGRLYTMFRGREKEVFERNILFYKEWTDEASQLLIEMDAELFCLLDKLGVRSLPTLLDYYESTDATSLTRKLQSIPAFQTIWSPMKPVVGGWVVDFGSRYFTEDFPYGLRTIHDVAHASRVPCPNIDRVYEWGMNAIK